MGFLFLFLKPTTPTSFFILLLLLTLLLSFLTTPTRAHPHAAAAAADSHLSTPGFGDIANSANPSSSPPHPPQLNNAGPTRSSSFRPSIAIIVGVLTTVFSVFFLILLYAKHCKGSALVVVGANSNSGPSGPSPRKNSGIDRSIVESLPVFRFGSLRGHKDGLECAVCLTRFDQTEVLRLLPKCKHAFHVECVDTWLDAHSTCPLCRYRVDPEDVLLVDDAAKLLQPKNSDVVIEIENDPGFRRISGRHSFAGERRPGHHQIQTWSFRRSLDSWTAFRKKSEQAAVGCFDRPRKDGLLLGQHRTRLEHRIIVSPTGSGYGPGGLHQRWSDLQPSDLLYLRSEMIMSEGLTRHGAEQQSENDNGQQVIAGPAAAGGGVGPGEIVGSRRSWSGGGGRSVINSRSVSEITGLSRFSSRATGSNGSQQEQQQRQIKLVARWLAWVSSLSRSAIRTERTTVPTPTSPPTIC
ncbi:RING-H2 finger protein ATL43-like [Pyrus communis]|uniref:RING-H2 finger protein ATL43-like n=1 Tax=Pyrus communis TaxID=23211 RepID=UPI0035C14961